MLRPVLLCNEVKLMRYFT